MTYIYAAMWFAVGLILIFRMGKENRIFYAAGAFFIILGGWWLAAAMGTANLFVGVWGWVLRGITAVALTLVCVAFFKETKKNNKDFNDKNKPDENQK